MKRYSELTQEQQRRAVRLAFDRLLDAVSNRGLRFNDIANGNRLQERIDACIEKAEREQLDHMIPEYVAAACMEDLVQLAEQTARNAVFVENETTMNIGDL